MLRENNPATSRYAKGLRQMECLARAVRDKRTQSGEEGRAANRLPDEILAGFHQACDRRDLNLAERLLQEVVRHGCDLDTLVAAHERLWLLRHPEP